MNSQNRDNTKPKAEKKDKCARCGEPQLSTIHKFVKDGFGHTFIDISLNKQPTLKPNGWEELKEKLREVRKEAKITFIESPYGYIDDSFFENKAWKVIEESLSQAILSAEKETVKRCIEALPKKKELFIQVYDNSSHRYQIPWSKRDDWFKWCEIPENDERSLETPEWAKRIDGMPLEDNEPFNSAIDQATKALLSLPDQEQLKIKK